MQVIVFFAALFLSASIATAGPIDGTVDRVVDGDTLDVCRWSPRLSRSCVRIRLCGIDAPEASDPGGPEATRALRMLIGGKALRCIPVGQGSVCDGRSQPTSHDRVVAQCWLSGIDIAAEMVRRGHACDWAKFSGGHYSRTTSGKVCRR